MEESFEYTYSATEQEEILRLRNKYLPREEESKLQRLRRLDKEAERAGTVAAITVGTLGLLVFGAGMSACLVASLYGIGISLGVIGGILIGIAWPLYRHITKRQRAKIAPEILRLTEELS